MTHLLLAVDIGTSSIRASLYDLEGNAVTLLAVDTPPVSYPRPGWAEQDAVAIWARLVGLLRKIAECSQASSIGALAIGGQIGTVAVDANGEPVYPSFNWQDRRAVKQADWLSTNVGEERLYIASGKRIDSERDACRLLWLRDNVPEDWQRVRWVYSLKDFIVHRLTGVVATDPIHASYTLLYDASCGGWNQAVVQSLGFDPVLLPPIVESATIVGWLTPEAAIVTGLPVGLPVAAGGPDGSVGMMGAGLTQPGDAALVMGTSDVLFACTQYQVQPSGGVLIHLHAVPGYWLTGGPQGLAGGALQWLLRTTKECSPQEEPAAWSAIEETVLNLAPGAEGLMFLPSLTGERTPYWNPGVRGSMIGLTPRHGTLHLIRALVEGLAFGTRRLLEELSACGVSVGRLLLIGNGAQGELRPRITAAVTGIPVVTISTSESTLMGAAMLAGMAIGLLEVDQVLTWTKVDRVIQPNPDLKAFYDRLYPIYTKWQSAQIEIFTALATVTQQQP